jgi:rRNA pseudouridine-1189 N-methylase Emg1 (Nep1/Mra1 family)
MSTDKCPFFRVYKMPISDLRQAQELASPPQKKKQRQVYIHTFSMFLINFVMYISITNIFQNKRYFELLL